MMKHAPAPWTAHFTGDALWEIYADGSEIKHADVFGCNQEMDEANAHLIAAAPDLLELARMLALNLPDYELDLAREVWGNTNVAVITHWRDELLAIIALAAPPAGADATLEKE